MSFYGLFDRFGSDMSGYILLRIDDAIIKESKVRWSIGQVASFYNSFNGFADNEDNHKYRAIIEHFVVAVYNEEF